MTLLNFLRARIDEDERDARVALSVQSSPGHGRAPQPGEVEAFDAARVLVECEAKRRIIELAYEATGYDMTVDLERASSARADSRVAFVGDRILEVLALPYRYHADYDEAWRPSSEGLTQPGAGDDDE